MQERQVITAKFQCIAHEVLQELLSELHVILQIIKSHLRFNHPELCEVACSIGILCTESWSEGIDISQRQGVGFPFELSRYCKVGVAAKEVFLVVDLSLLITGRIFRIQCCHAEHSTRALGIGACYDG